MFGFVIALRNLTRNPIRSTISLFSIIFGVTALLLSGGFIQWIFFDMRETTILSRLGHIQVTKPGFLAGGSADPFAFLLPAHAKETEMIAAQQGVRTIASRISFSGLISRGEATVSFLADGVEPEKELAVSAQLQISEGQNLSSRDPKGIIVGEGLAGNLDLKVGDRVVLLATTENGGVNAVEGHVRGLFYTTSKAFDDTFLRVPISTARELLKVSGAHTWVVLLENTDSTDEVRSSLQSAFSKRQIRLDVIPWTAQASFYHNTIKLFSAQFGIVQIIIAVIIVLSISNLMTMSILERTGEIGTLMAMGNNRRKIMLMFVTEGLLLGAAGAIAGLLIGLIIAHAVSAIGIPMPPAPGMTRGFTGEILVTPRLALTAVSLAVVTTVLASLYPSWKASRMQIVDALRHNR